MQNAFLRICTQSRTFIVKGKNRTSRLYVMPLSWLKEAKAEQNWDLESDGDTFSVEFTPLLSRQFVIGKWCKFPSLSWPKIELYAKAPTNLLRLQQFHWNELICIRNVVVRYVGVTEHVVALGIQGYLTQSINTSLIIHVVYIKCQWYKMSENTENFFSQSTKWPDLQTSLFYPTKSPKIFHLHWSAAATEKGEAENP